MISKQTAKELIIGLEAFRGHDSEECNPLVEPLSEFVFRNNFYNLEEVNRLVKAILTTSPVTTTMETKPSVTTQFLADQIKPWIEDIRQTLFHSKSAPFSTVEGAQKWWNEAKKKADEWTKRVDEWEARRQAMLDKYPPNWLGARFPEQGSSARPFTLEEWRHVESLEAGEPPEKDEQVKALFSLIHEVLEINKATSFSVTSLEMHILADAEPVLPSHTFGILRETHTLPSGKNLLNLSARVTIRGDLTFRDLRSLYRSIRQELGIKRSKHPTTKHSQLYEMVRRRGDIPRGKGTVAFWESVRKEWNNLPNEDKYKTWKGVKLAYERIVAQLEHRVTRKGGTP